ncbi:spinocerebellar ataxia type 10 protein domain-containing protein [Vararia minispora EC-137]|uniref:Spinocerebellar ataxia type 10 protein domain-containing protein n=1 Tax=Vararia minispora EC-137 TaxID=1314806 RepID=A0ACB8QHV4_9AGAM|nr:spinocerebellar ataxia type 10 protein domain-containing protein [Vararia minispora EC-137]
MWSDTAQASEDDGAEEEAPLVIGLAKMTRNLVAGVPQNQERAFAIEPSIRRLIRVYTAWTREADEEARVATRLLTQTLSNIVTANDPLQDDLWRRYLVSADEGNVLLRLVQSHDPRTLIALIVLLHNCVSSSATRSASLARSNTGIHVLVALLDKLEFYSEAEEPDQGKVFDLGYALFSSLFKHGQFSELYTRTTIPTESISPSQMTLLRLTDAYLQSRTGAQSDDDVALTGALIHVFHSLSDAVQAAIRQVVGENCKVFSSALDLQLPATCAALVLGTQCLVALLLAEMGADVLTCKRTVLAARPGVIESIPETLRLLDIFLPRITFGKATPSPAAPQRGLGKPAVVDATGFAYVKRDLVRLLGTLAHDDLSVQDRTREAGGIPAVLNLCVIDERNPYLREHAIFALRNLLHGNPENQAIVEGLQPQGAWDANTDLAHAMR